MHQAKSLEREVQRNAERQRRAITEHGIHDSQHSSSFSDTLGSSNERHNPPHGQEEGAY